MYFMPINKGWWGDRGPGQTKKHGLYGNIESFDSKMWWEVGLRDKKGVYRVYSQGEMALCGGDASCYVACREGGDEGREQKTSF